MQTIVPNMLAIALASGALAQARETYTNFIRQVQYPTGVQWDASVAASGQQDSALPVDLGGARFELWTVRSAPLTTYLLDTRFVSAYAPVVEIAISSEDPYQVIPRTRADRPFRVDVTISGLLGGATDPAASKAVKLLRHVQPTGVDQDTENGESLSRTQATLLSQALLNQNGTYTLDFTLTSVPSSVLTKARGEERFSVFSLEEPGVSPESQLASKHIQIWPVADASISGISENERIRLRLPQLALTFNGLYPGSATYTQVYRGSQKLGTEGTRIPAGGPPKPGDVPESRVLVLREEDYAFAIDGDGQWTMEIITVTPFGVERLAHVTFEVDRTMELQGTFTTLE